ncbi:MAG: YfiR family protein [Caulobacteraceae bacterium]
MLRGLSAGMRAGWLAAALAACACAARADGSLETAIKASYLYKLPPFVTWPAAVAGAPSDPFVICVVGEDPFGSVLDRAIAGQRVGPRPIIARRLPRASRSTGCQIMFIGGSAQQSVGDALSAMRGAPVLTVTDGPGPAGVINFVVDGGRVRFRIDDALAATDGLTISSKLLSLAVSVKPRAKVAP